MRVRGVVLSSICPLLDEVGSLVKFWLLKSLYTLTDTEDSLQPFFISLTSSLNLTQESPNHKYTTCAGI